MLDQAPDTEIYKVRVYENFAWGDLSLFIGRVNKGIPKTVEWFDGESWVKHEIGMRDHKCLNITKELAQQLVDELWNCGVRPNEAKGSAGQLSAVENHLQDMRTIAFNKLELKKD